MLVFFLLLRTECFVSIPNVYVEALKYNVMGFGDGPFGKQSGLDEVMRVGPT